MSVELPKPRPVPTETSRPFWDALRQEKVRIQRCADCATWVHYPRSRCTTCLSDHLGWEEVDGAGIVFSFSVARVPTVASFTDEVPQVIAIVELPQGLRLTTTIVGAEPAAVSTGAAVVPVFDHGDDGMTLLRYRLA